MICALKHILDHEIHSGVEKVVDKAVDKVSKFWYTSVFYRIAYNIGTNNSQ